MIKKILIILVCSIIPIFFTQKAQGSVSTLADQGINTAKRWIMQGADYLAGQFPHRSLQQKSLISAGGIFLVVLGTYVAHQGALEMKKTVLKAYKKIKFQLLSTSLGIGAIFGGAIILGKYGINPNDIMKFAVGD